MKNKIRVGVIGSGWVARMRHIPALLREGRTEITSLYNPNHDLAEEALRTLPIKDVYSDFNDFLESGIDAVVICTPPATHFELARKALESGKHVLLEKPFTIDPREGEILEVLAREKRLILFPAHNFIFSRAMTKSKRLLSSGSCGEIISAAGVQWSSWRRELPSWYQELPGGLFFDEGPHLMYLLEQFIGEMRVTHASRTVDKEFERYNAEFQGEHGSGMLTAWFGAPMSEWFIVVACTKKTLLLDIFRDTCITFPAENKRTPSYLMKVIANFDRQIWSSFVHWFLYRFTKGSHLFGADKITSKFIDAILGGDPVLVARDGYRAVALLREIIDRSNS